MQTKSESTASNIKWIYLITFLGECYLTMAVWLFFYTRYLSFSEITVLVVMQQVVQLVFEIPTGAIADLLGKKRTLALSYFLYSISLALTPFFSQFWVFFALEFLKGIAKSLSSGTFEALTYDSLAGVGKESDYGAVNAKITSISWIAYIIAGVLGGALYDYNYHLPYLLLAGFYLLSLILIIFALREPTVDTEKGFTFRQYMSQTLSGFRELFKTRRTALLVVFLLFGTLGYYTASEFLGVSQGKAFGLSATQVSLLFTGGYVVSAILAQFFAKLQNRFSHVGIAVTAGSFMLLSYLAAALVTPLVGMTLIMGRISSSSTFSNIRSVLLNKEISSKNRATALSTFSLLYTLPYTIIVFFGGKIIDATSVNTFATFFGFFLTVGMVILVLLLAKHPTRQIPDESQT